MNEKRIGFACTTIFHYIHFKGISRYFPVEAIYIISTPRHINNRYEKLENYFLEKNVEYCDSEDIISKRVEISTIVAPYFLPLLSFIESEVYKVRVLYGYAKDAWNYAEWNREFDLILAYGPYSQEKLEIKAPTVSIGHPRFKDGGMVNTAAVKDMNGTQLSSWLESGDKSTILYCPTWGDLSSVDWFAQAVGGLSQRYKMIIKLHHGITLSKDFDSTSYLNSNELFICDETVDLFDLFQFSDVVISDYSGAIFDAILANKKIVLINSLSEPVVDTGILNNNKMINVSKIQESSINDAGSLDIRIRDILPFVNHPEELSKTVAAAIENEVVNYSEINIELYSHQDANASYRAYKEIVDLISKKESRTTNRDPQNLIFDMAQFLNFVKSADGKEFIVWGAGDYGQLIISWLHYNGLTISKVLDSDPSKLGKTICGTTISSSRAYAPKKGDQLIIAFVTKKLENIINESIPCDIQTDMSILIPFNRE